LGAYGNGTNQKETKPKKEKIKQKIEKIKRKKKGTFITFTIGLRFTAEIVADIFFF
jgi:hypothetical protein